MYLTQSNVIRGLSKEEYSILRETCQYSDYSVRSEHALKRVQRMPTAV